MLRASITGVAAAVALMSAAACGARSELFVDDDAASVDDAANASDAPVDAFTDTVDATRVDGSTPDSSLISDSSLPPPDAPDAGAPDACIPIVSPDPGATVWSNGAVVPAKYNTQLNVFASARGPSGTTAIAGQYSGPVSLGSFALPSPIDTDGEFVDQVFVAELDAGGHYLFALGLGNATAAGSVTETWVDPDAGTWGYARGGFIATSFDPNGGSRWSVSGGNAGIAVGIFSKHASTGSGLVSAMVARASATP